MPQASYRIISSVDGWIIEHEDGKTTGYALPEAAFEAAAAAASLDLKQRRNIVLSVEFPESPEDAEALEVDCEPALQQNRFDNPAGK